MQTTPSKPEGPSKEKLQEFVGKVLTDDRFRERLFENPKKAAEEMGFKLTDRQVEVFKNISPDVLKMAREVQDPHAVVVLIPIADVAIVAAFA